jgi:hypothetical protein
LAGCEADKIGKTVPVRGKVSVDGAPLSAGVVSFMPDQSKGNKLEIAATGEVRNGEYTLSTTASAGGTKTGCPPGWYRVTISTGMPGQGVGAKGVEVKKDGGAPPPPPVSLVAPKYQSFQDTPLIVEVTEATKEGQYELKASSK